MTQSPSQSELVLALAADEEYAMPLAVTLNSALRSLDGKRPLRLMILDGGMSGRSESRLRRIALEARPDAKVEWHRSDLAPFADAKVSPWGSSANYLRLLIPQLVPDSTERAIYLDGDTIVLGDLADLWDQCQRQSPAAVFAVLNFTFSDAISAFGEEGTRALGLSESASYFNSGVLVINVPVWRRENIAARVSQTAVVHKPLMRFSDQDALNIVLSERWERLDETWNVMLNYLHRYETGNPSQDGLERERLRSEARILHFGGRSKPWQPGYLGTEGRRYRRSLYESGWFESRTERITWTLRYWLHPAWLTSIEKRLTRSVKRRLATRFPNLAHTAKKTLRPLRDRG